MLLPLRTNVQPWRTPYANYALIAVNVVVFILQYHIDAATGHLGYRSWVNVLMLNPARPYVWQFVTYAFLHGGFWHIVGNMFFLYLFGNNVNDKLGTVGYLCFYLAGAVFSGIGHTLLNTSPVLGASGAVAAVTGAYLVLFPQTLITVMYWFIIIGTIEVPAMYFIAVKMIIIDNLISSNIKYVAYDAHLAGYGFGVLSILAFLATGLVSGSHFDLWSMLKLWNRRRQYRSVVSEGYNPFSDEQETKQVVSREITPKAKEINPEVSRLRAEISTRIMERNMPAAAAVYLELMKTDPQQILPRQQLIDIANQLASENMASESAQAYEQFLEHYSNYEYANQVELMLGVLYSRYLNKKRLAKKHLSAALDKLTDPNQRNMCREELKKLAE